MFEKPSALFRWSLKFIESGNPIYTYEICFKQYQAAVNKEGYLWEMYDGRLRELIDEVTDQPKRVLEVGCGFGHDLIWVSTQGHYCVGIDVNSDFVEISRRTKVKIEKHIGKYLNINFKRINLLNMHETEMFDLIYMKDVFHHLEPREEVVKKLASLLAPGGKLIIVEPNAFNALIQFQMFRIRGFKVVIKKTDSLTGETYLFGNERLVTGRKMFALFKRTGLEGKIRHMRLLPTKLVDNVLFVLTARWLENLGLGRVPLACIHTIYVGTKSS
jgi:2-polyprenyl-3-methyl-5-hydroxy-6-metoxy-1,4-benzoquinol methylase